MDSTLSRARRVLPVALVLALGVTAGCGKGRYPVRGKVTLEDGTPLTKGLVVFESTEEKPPITARGDIQADGTYQLGTDKPGNGVPAGKYRALVSPRDYENIDGLEGPRRPPSFDPRFADFSSSGLQFEVKSGPNEIPIQVTRPAKRPR
jgi:hypothetical protein